MTDLFLAAENGGLPPALLDSVDIMAKSAAIGAGIFAIVKGLKELDAATEVRRQDLRWKKAAKAHELIHEIHASEYAASAVHMLDWWGSSRIRITAGGASHEVGTEQIRAALGRERSSLDDPVDQAIWDSFDWFLYHLDRVAHFESIGLVHQDDVLAVFRPYLARIAENFSLFVPLITMQDYQGVREMLRPRRADRQVAR
jgi:hypothetical protein